MTTNALAVAYVASANLLVSSYCNGFSRMGASKKKALMGAREALILQLSGLESILSDPKTRTDAELVGSSISICLRYFDHFREVLVSSWKEKLEDAGVVDCKHHPLSIATQSQNLDGLREVLRTMSQNAVSADDRIELLLERYVVGSFCFKEAISQLKIKYSGESKGLITRSIVFPPEAKQAGMAILAYFGEVIEKKYPGIDCEIRIEQTGGKVSLIVETPSGQIEKIEHELSQYSLVVTGRLKAEEFMPQPLDALALKQKLQIAELEVKQTRELMHLERASYDRRIESLEDQIGFMRQILDKTQYEASQASSVLRSLALQHAGQAVSILQEVANCLETGGRIDTDHLARELQKAEKSSPGILDRLSELFVKGAIQGAAGNYLYAALNVLQKMM
jgi:hypothetical protein